MIILDSRRGSGELLRLFSPYGVTVECEQLNYEDDGKVYTAGDACWAGNGPDGECMVGVERKRLSDMIQSMRKKRLSGEQVPKLHKAYEYVYLIIEGYWRSGSSGELEENVYRGGKSTWQNTGLRYRELDGHIASLEMKCGMVVRRTSTSQETVAVIVDLYKWWQTEWDQHKSHLGNYCPLPSGLISGRKARFVSLESMIRQKYGNDAVLVWKMAAQMDGVDEKAELVAAHFRTVRRMASGSLSDWRNAGFGDTLAKRCMIALGGIGGMK